jgi:hypothetical protein
MEMKKPSFVESAGGWDGIAITAVALVLIFIGCWIVANGHVS